MVLITIYFFLGKLEPISNVTWCEMYSLQVLSDILVDRINYRVMTSVYYEIKGGWTLRQKIREQVSYFILFFDKKRSHTCTAVNLWITMDSTILESSVNVCICIRGICVLLIHVGCQDAWFSCDGHGDTILERDAGIFTTDENCSGTNNQRQERWTGSSTAQSHVGFIR